MNNMSNLVVIYIYLLIFGIFIALVTQEISTYITISDIGDIGTLHQRDIIRKTED